MLNFSNAPNASATEKGDTLYFTYEVPASTANVPTTIYRDTNTQFFSSWTNVRPLPSFLSLFSYAPLSRSRRPLCIPRAATPRWMTLNSSSR